MRLSLRARTDIDGIHEYIAQHNSGAATAVVRQIRATCQLLSRYSGLGRKTDIPMCACFPRPVTPILSITASVRANWSSSMFAMAGAML
ncbi:type II toxin-antitoxin system RelE/ParE family toxin [Bradyrhizobium sp. USDA 10063]